MKRIIAAAGILFIALIFVFADNGFSKFSSVENYFRAANENVGALNCNVVINERDVSEKIKTAVLERDKRICVICGSTKDLEVDHARALQNGGTNDMANLFTLCHDCHTEKTKMDNSLRRKRDQDCRKLNKKE